MNTLFFIIWGLSLVAIVLFIALAAFQYVKRDKVQGKKQLRNTGISAIVMLASLALFISTSEPSETEVTKEDETVATSADTSQEEKVEPKETEEERIAHEQKEAEEKALAEQKAKEEAEVKEKKDEEAKAAAEQKLKTESTVAVWQTKVKEIAASNGSPTDKYDAIMLYAKDYSSTDDEIAEFEKYIINQYLNKQYLADITNAEYMLGNIFRANVINEFYGQVNSPINDFAFDFYQNTKYTYRGVDAVDSEAVQANERQMTKALAKIQ